MAYKHLNIHERNIIASQLREGVSLRAIGRLLKRCHSTISRDVRRHTKHYTTEYSPEKRQEFADFWKHEPTNAKRRNNKALYRHVIKRLERKQAPDIIAGRLPIIYPNDLSMRLSHQTIYRWIYNDKLDGGTLYKHLLKKRGWPKRHGLWPNKGGKLEDRKSIHDRPATIETRNEIGHWEGDLVEGERGSGYFITITERKSRKLLTRKIDTKEAKVVSKNITQMLKPVLHKVKTITFDNGREFYDFKTIENTLGIKVYFSDPYSSWQRGSNEHTNGLLRRFFPKKTNFKNITNKQLATATNKINNQPRKLLQYYTANECFLKG